MSELLSINTARRQWADAANVQRTGPRIWRLATNSWAPVGIADSFLSLGGPYDVVTHSGVTRRNSQGGCVRFVAGITHRYGNAVSSVRQAISGRARGAQMAKGGQTQSWQPL